MSGETKFVNKLWPDRLWDTIWVILKRVLPRLSNMISHLVKVKEWMVSGQVGTPPFKLGAGWDLGHLQLAAWSDHTRARPRLPGGYLSPGR